MATEKMSQKKYIISAFKKPSSTSVISYNFQLNFKKCHIDIILNEVKMKLSGNFSPPASLSAGTKKDYLPEPVLSLFILKKEGKCFAAFR